jgi:hypothetical protein
MISYEWLILAVVVLVAVLFFVVYQMLDMRIEQQILKDELAVHFRLLHSIDRNVADLLTKAEEEGDI